MQHAVPNILTNPFRRRWDISQNRWKHLPLMQNGKKRGPPKSRGYNLKEPWLTVQHSQTIFFDSYCDRQSESREWTDHHSSHDTSRAKKLKEVAEHCSSSASSSFLFGSLYWPASKIKTVLCNSLDNRLLMITWVYFFIVVQPCFVQTTNEWTLNIVWVLQQQDRYRLRGHLHNTGAPIIEARRCGHDWEWG